MMARVNKALGCVAACLGLVTLALTPAYAQYGNEEAVGLSAGIRGGLLIPDTALSGKPNIQGGLFFRYGLMPKLQAELGLGYGRLTTEDNAIILDSTQPAPAPGDDVNLQYRRDPNRLVEYGTDMALIDFRLVYSPFAYETWNPYIYGGIGWDRFDVADETPRRGSFSGIGSTAYIPLGVGTQKKLSDSWGLELGLGYNIGFHEQLDEDPVGGNDNFWTLSIALVTGSLGVKPPMQERVAPPMPPKPKPRPITKPRPMPEPEPEVEMPLPEFDRVFFSLNTTDLSSDAKDVLEQVSIALQQDLSLLLSIHGHADDLGPGAYNLKLSQRRAQMVKDYLTSNGVSAWRLGIRAFGEAHPIASNDTEDGRAQNRRVELKPMR